MLFSRKGRSEDTTSLMGSKPRLIAPLLLVAIARKLVTLSLSAIGSMGSLATTILKTKTQGMLKRFALFMVAMGIQ